MALSIIPHSLFYTVQNFVLWDYAGFKGLVFITDSYIGSKYKHNFTDSKVFFFFQPAVYRI